jgi:hypothetical protein
VAFIIAGIVAPSGDRSIVITRDCFEPATAFLLFGSPEVGDEGLSAGSRAAGTFFAGFDMEILRSVRATSWPHHGRPTLGTKPVGQDLWARLVPTLKPVPLCLARKASPFWIMLLLSSRMFDHGMIDQIRRALRSARSLGFEYIESPTDYHAADRAPREHLEALVQNGVANDLEARVALLGTDKRPPFYAPRLKCSAGGIGASNLEKSIIGKEHHPVRGRLLAG